MKKLLMKQRASAYDCNINNIISLLEENMNSKFLDLGCDDGSMTMRFAKKVNTKNIYGYEIITSAAEKARNRGINVVVGDLNSRLKFKDEMFDIIFSNQVIEHLNDTDHYLQEIHRILKPGGYVIISTENLASWHNIFALILGFMPFSLTNVSSKTGAVGNPLAPHSGEVFWSEDSWQHQRVFTTKGLQHLSKLFSFKIEKILGAGYYPFGNFFSKFDPYHSAFITLKLRKEEIN